MAKKPLLTPQELRQLLRYQPDTGKLFWLIRTPDMLGDDVWTARELRRWNTRYADREAFTARLQGYAYGHVRGIVYYGHRVAWALHHGCWPSNEIDHINGVRDDNRISNLRIVSTAQNLRNRQVIKSNTSGVMGVTYRDGRWLARITHNDRRFSLGTFETFEEAASARKAAEAKYGYHRNHNREAIS